MINRSVWANLRFRFLGILRYSLVIGICLTTSLSYGLPKIQHTIDVEAETCVKQNPTSIGQSGCLKKALSKWESEVNGAYQNVLKALDDPLKKKLEKSQKAWLEFFETEANTSQSIRESMESGQWGTEEWRLKIALIKNRVETLNQYQEYLELNKQLEEPQKPQWYVVLGLFPNDEGGIQSANSLVAQLMKNTSSQNFIVSESSSYRGLSDGYYVVLKGPFSTEKGAENWVERMNLSEITSNISIRKLELRTLY
jgi:uncharacterized protein YecT (DUF1311 family)